MCWKTLEKVHKEENFSFIYIKQNFCATQLYNFVLRRQLEVYHRLRHELENTQIALNIKDRKIAELKEEVEHGSAVFELQHVRFEELEKLERKKNREIEKEERAWLKLAHKFPCPAGFFWYFTSHDSFPF